MSKGIWTKHITVDDKVFYFNAEQNKSTYNVPPVTAVVHEAHTMIPLDHTNVPTQPSHANSISHQASVYERADIPNSTTTTNYVAGSNFIENTENEPEQRRESNAADSTNNASTDITDSTSISTLPTTSVPKQPYINKRFQQNTVNKSKDDGSNSYLSQVNSIHKASGTSSDDNGGKWLVR